MVVKERRTILSPVEFQKQSPARLEKSCPNIVDEKFPIGLRPFQPFAVLLPIDAMKTDTMASHEIKLLSKIRQRCLGKDPRDNAPNIEKLSCAAEERFIIGVESECFVAEEPAEIEKITRAAAKIENLERRRAIEPKILHALDVYADPVSCVFVGVNPSRIRSIRITLAQTLQFGAVNRGQDPSRTYGMSPTAGMFPQALSCVTGPELFEFMRNSHLEMMQESSLHSRNEASNPVSP